MESHDSPQVISGLQARHHFDRLFLIDVLSVLAITGETCAECGLRRTPYGRADRQQRAAHCMCSSLVATSTNSNVTSLQMSAMCTHGAGAAAANLDTAIARVFPRRNAYASIRASRCAAEIFGFWRQRFAQCKGVEFVRSHAATTTSSHSSVRYRLLLVAALRIEL